MHILWYLGSGRVQSGSEPRISRQSVARKRESGGEWHNVINDDFIIVCMTTTSPGKAGSSDILPPNHQASCFPSNPAQKECPFSLANYPGQTCLCQPQLKWQGPRLSQFACNENFRPGSASGHSLHFHLLATAFSHIFIRASNFKIPNTINGTSNQHRNPNPQQLYFLLLKMINYRLSTFWCNMMSSAVHEVSL